MKKHCDVQGAPRCWLNARAGLDRRYKAKLISIAFGEMEPETKSQYDTVDILPPAEVQCEERQRRHIRWSTSGVVPAFVIALTFLCVASLFVTMHSVKKVSALEQRIQKLEESEYRSSKGQNLGLSPLDGESHEKVEQLEGDTLNAATRVFLRRHKRQAKEKKKKPKRKKTTSAIHLNLNVEEPTKDELQIYNGQHAYIYKAWKVAEWAKDEEDYQFNQNTGTVKIQRKGLYFIYSQILYHNSATRSSYVVMVDKDPFIKCMESVDAIMPDSHTSADSARYKTCYVGAARTLEKGQNVWIKDLYSRFVTTDPTANFFGLIKIADLEK